MSHHRLLLRLRFASVLAGAMLLVTDVVAQATNGVTAGTNETAGLVLGLLPGEYVGQEQVVRALIRSGHDHEFVFVVPNGLRARATPGGAVVMISRDMSYSVSIRLVEPSPGNPGLKEALAERIASQYTRTSHLEEFVSTVAQREGIGFQFRQALPQVGLRSIRILWVPFKAGVMEFVLDTDENSPSAGRGVLDMILLTLRSNERGKLEIVKRSDKT